MVSDSTLPRKNTIELRFDSLGWLRHGHSSKKHIHISSWLRISMATSESFTIVAVQYTVRACPYSAGWRDHSNENGQLGLPML